MESTNTSFLQMRKIEKNFDKVVALDKVDFELGHKEILGLLGGNGAGKTTTISILSTLFSPSAGDASILGYSVTKNPMEV